MNLPTHPCLWQSSLQVLSAAQRANSVGLRKVSAHSQSFSPATHWPPDLPMALHVAEQKPSPRLQRDGSRTFRLSRLKTEQFSPERSDFTSSHGSISSFKDHIEQSRGRLEEEASK